MLPIQDLLLSPGPNRPGDLIRPRRIIIHRTGNPGTTALQNRNYFESLNHPPKAGQIYASAHYIVDGTAIIRCIPENERAHHCRGANFDGIGIEACEPLNEAIYQNVLALIVDICRRRGFQPTPDFIQPHSKFEPVNRRFDPYFWGDFRSGKANPGRDLCDPFAFYADLGKAFAAPDGSLS
jgi:N-acetylmuramoyl-L-alanine amidase CwlA